MGALVNHITGGGDAKTFQPMNVNFGLFPDLEIGKLPKGQDRGKARKQAMARRAVASLDAWLGLKAEAAE
jgi:methylenetetrahydrofolate--tRNA-(uracil-5-)-methyltransferase